MSHECFLITSWQYLANANTNANKNEQEETLQRIVARKNYTWYEEGENTNTVRGFLVSSSKKRGVKRASLVAPIKLGLKMCVIPWGILIQAY